MRTLRRARLEQRAVLALAGEDRRDFLQALLSNDLRKLAPQRALWAALLTPQGKYLFDFFLLDAGTRGLLLETAAERASALLARLGLYRLRARVEIADVSERYRVEAIFGEAAAAAFDLPPEAGAARAFGGGMLFVDPRHPDLGLRAILPREETGTLLADRTTEADPAAYEMLRLELGIPEGEKDLVPEKSLPLEANFAELGAVDFDKGCFIGQEVTARMKHRGRLRKRLLPVEIRGAATPGSPVIAGDGREAGELRSLAGNRGLALLRLDRLDGPLRAGEATIIPHWPAWLKKEE